MLKGVAEATVVAAAEASVPAICNSNNLFICNIITRSLFLKCNRVMEIWNFQLYGLNSCNINTTEKQRTRTFIMSVFQIGHFYASYLYANL